MELFAIQFGMMNICIKLKWGKQITCDLLAVELHGENCESRSSDRIAITSKEVLIGEEMYNLDLFCIFDYWVSL